MIVKNPTDSEISIQYKGDTFVVPANGQASMSDEVATYWKTKIHAFISVEAESEKAAAKEVKAEVVSEKVEEKVEEKEVAKAEAPADEPKKSKTTK